LKLKVVKLTFLTALSLSRQEERQEERREQSW
jgi:hypothetical protein